MAAAFIQAMEAAQGLFTFFWSNPGTFVKHEEHDRSCFSAQAYGHRAA